MVFTFSLRSLARVARGFTRQIPTPLTKESEVSVSFRCALTDCDFFWHQNNAAYFRCAELARWEMLPAVGLLQHAVRQQWMFLVVEQECKYLRMIRPFSRFEIRTKCSVLDDKWLVFHHDFVSPDGLTTYAEAKVRAVCKRTSGKTVRPSEFPEFIAS